mmetsp:Transcript_12662/g.29391  ORF Transcript_12662/g.29391 Transcript_12662/m.29391 type:complete len:178 (-) Transcript_12662:1440-1973(-)
MELYETIWLIHCCFLKLTSTSTQSVLKLLFNKYFPSATSQKSTQQLAKGLLRTPTSAPFRSLRFCICSVFIPQPFDNMTRAKISKAPRASDEERKERRRAANRRSAQKSRYREMVLMDELQKTVSELTKRNAMLREENEAFRRDVAVLKGVVQQRELRQEVVSRPWLMMARCVGFYV